jgi:hypothetical protein
VAGGVLALWFPADGLDLYVSYVAGRCSTAGVSPYERAAYQQTWQNLETPAALVSTADFPFAYPPSWMPFCVGLSVLPWGAALALWKLTNVACLVGSVLLSFRLLQHHGLDPHDRYAAWCFALLLSPTLSVMTTGQTSLFVVCMLVLAGHALWQGRAALAGLPLALAMIKPQLAIPFVAFLCLRGEVSTIGVMAGCFAALTWAGLALSHSDATTYLASVGTYAASNAPTSHIAVGAASLLAHLTQLGAPTVTLIGLLAGALLVGGVLYAHRTHGRRVATADALPVLLYVAPLCFRCNGYDLVALIPLFAWSRTNGLPVRLRRTMQGLCWTLVVPRAAVSWAFETLGQGLVPADSARMAELSFRSWILLLLLPPVLLALRLRTRTADIGERPTVARAEVA